MCLMRICDYKFAGYGYFAEHSRPFTEQELSKIVANPFYCLSAVHPIFAQVHEPLISEEKWVGAAAAAIEDMGAEKFLRLLLENLKGNYIVA